MTKREEFSEETKLIIARRAAYRCSFPTCDRVTIGPGKKSNQFIVTGEAAHIYSAATNGPRGQGDLTPLELRSPDNGIWFCRVHSKIPDLNGGRDYPPSRLHSYKALHESRIARELGEVTCPFGWLEELVIRVSPFVRHPIEINFTKTTIFMGENSSGKTTSAQYVAAALSPELLELLNLPEFLDTRHEYTMIFRCPQRHVLDVSISDGIIVHRFDGVTVPFNPVPFKVVQLTQGVDFGGEIRDLATAFRVPSAIMKQALDHLTVFRSRSFEGIRIVDYETVEVLRDGKFLPARYLSGGAGKMFMLECAIALASFWAHYQPTLLILDEGLHRLDQDNRLAYLHKLNDPAFSFQTILIDTSASQNSIRGSCQYVDFSPSTS